MDRMLNPRIEKQTIYEIYRACRLCGAGAGYKMPIIQNVVDLENPELDLRQKIRECVQIEVNQDDKMPPLICELCVDKVNDFYEFLELCRQTNKRTRLRLGLPIQTVSKGSADGDCILGMTEPVYVNKETSLSQPVSKLKGNSQKKLPKKQDIRSKAAKPSAPASRQVKRPPTPPRVTRHSRLALAEKHLQDTQIKSEPKALKSILKRDMRVMIKDNTSLIPNRPKRARDQDIKPPVPVKKVKISMRAPPPCTTSRSTPKTNTQATRCVVCHHVFKNVRGLTSHIKIHTVSYTNAALACNPCGLWFSSADETATHHRRHRSKNLPYHCRRCSGDFKTVGAYDEHMTKGECASVIEVADAKCDVCWRLFATLPLLEGHKCPGAGGRLGGKCSFCSKNYTLHKNLKRHEAVCSRRKDKESNLDPALLSRLLPMKVRVARCDPLLVEDKQGRYDVSGVNEPYGLDNACTYPYLLKPSSFIKTEPGANVMVDIGDDVKNEFCTKQYINWDSSSDSDDEPSPLHLIPKPMETLSRLSLRTLFSAKCFGKVPRKRRRVKAEAFDVTASDFDMSRNIDSLISHLSDDDLGVPVRDRVSDDMFDSVFKGDGGADVHDKRSNDNDKLSNDSAVGDKCNNTVGVHNKQPNDNNKLINDCEIGVVNNDYDKRSNDNEKLSNDSAAGDECNDKVDVAADDNDKRSNDTDKLSNDSEVGDGRVDVVTDDNDKRSNDNYKLSNDSAVGDECNDKADVVANDNDKQPNDTDNLSNDSAMGDKCNDGRVNDVEPNDNDIYNVSKRKDSADDNGKRSNDKLSNDTAVGGECNDKRLNDLMSNDTVLNQIDGISSQKISKKDSHSNTSDSVSVNFERQKSDNILRNSQSIEYKIDDKRNHVAADKISDNAQMTKTQTSNKLEFNINDDVTISKSQIIDRNTDTTVSVKDNAEATEYRLETADDVERDVDTDKSICEVIDKDCERASETGNNSVRVGGKEMATSFVGENKDINLSLNDVDTPFKITNEVNETCVNKCLMVTDNDSVRDDMRVANNDSSKDIREVDESNDITKDGIKIDGNNDCARTRMEVDESNDSTTDTILVGSNDSVKHEMAVDCSNDSALFNRVNDKYDKNDANDEATVNSDSLLPKNTSKCADKSDHCPVHKDDDNRLIEENPPFINGVNKSNDGSESNGSRTEEFGSKLAVARTEGFGSVNGRVSEESLGDVSDTEMDDKRLMEALDAQIGETNDDEETKDSNDTGVNDDRKGDEDKNDRNSGGFDDRVHRKDDRHDDGNDKNDRHAGGNDDDNDRNDSKEDKITLEDLISKKDDGLQTMDLDNISDEEFDFDT